jgi:hypothetical protein
MIDAVTHAKQDCTSEVEVLNVVFKIVIGKAEEKTTDWGIQA